jgi:hypothetical protein
MYTKWARFEFCCDLHFMLEGGCGIVSAFGQNFQAFAMRILVFLVSLLLESNGVIEECILNEKEPSVC